MTNYKNKTYYVRGIGRIKEGSGTEMFMFLLNLPFLVFLTYTIINLFVSFIRNVILRWDIADTEIKDGL